MCYGSGISMFYINCSNINRPDFLCHDIYNINSDIFFHCLGIDKL